MFFSYLTELSKITQWRNAEKTIKSEILRELECLLNDLNKKLICKANPFFKKKIY